MSHSRNKQMKGKYYHQIDERSAFTFFHKFKKNYLSRLINSMLQFECIRPQSQFAPCHYPIVKSIQQIDNDTLIIKRDVLYKQYISNTRPYNQDIIIIKRNNKSQLLYQNFCDHGWKKQHKQIFSSGYIIQRCQVNLSSHQAFKNPQMIQIMSASYALKSVSAMNCLQKWCNRGDAFQNQLEYEERKKLNIKSFEETELSTLLELV